MKNAVIYARYSSEKQSEQSIEGQLRVCKEFAGRNGYRIVGTYADRAISGRTDNREEFQKMIADSAKRLFEFSIVYKLDRFARNRYDSAINKAVLKKNGVRVLSASEQITDSPEGIILESMLEGYAEYFSAELSQKVKRGIKESRIKGHYTGGAVLLGYEIVDKKWKIDETNAKIVQQMFNDYSNGMKLRDIADKLNANLIKSAKGSIFTVSIVSRMLRTGAYAGVVPEDNEYPNIIPPIISKELFEEVGKKLDLNKHRSGAEKANVNYLLSGKLFCGHCDTSMIGESGTSRTGATHYYYKCAKRKKTHDCNKKTVLKEGIENEVIEATIEFLFGKKRSGILRGIAEQTAIVYNKDLKDAAILDALYKQKADSEKAIGNLLKALEMGIFTPSTKQRLEELEETRDQIDCDLLLKSIFNASPIEEKTVYGYFLSFKDLDYSVYKNRERLVEMFIRKVVIFDDGSKKIYYNCSDDKSGDIKENTVSETEFGYGASGTPGENRTHICPLGGGCYIHLTTEANNFADGG